MCKINKFHLASVCFHILFSGVTNTSGLSFGQPCIENNLRIPGVCEFYVRCPTAQRLLYERGIALGLCSFDFGIPVVCCPDNSFVDLASGPQDVHDQAKPVETDAPDAGLQTNDTIPEGRPSGDLHTRVQETPAPEADDAALPDAFSAPGRPTSIWPGEKNKIVSRGRTPRVSQIKCEEYHAGIRETIGAPTDELDYEKRPHRPPTCFTAGGFVVGGREAGVGEYPFMAAIGWPTGANPQYRWLCGGSLISERFILTAGHCTFTQRTDIISPQPTVVRLGDHNLREQVDDLASPMTCNITRIVKHPDYRPPKKYHDLALLQLDAEVRFNFYMRPICLWTEEMPYDSIGVSAAGWGLLKARAKETSDVLMSVDLTIFNSSSCSKNFPSNRNWDGFLDSQLCAGDLFGGKDTCQGDSGGPLVHRSVRKDEKCRFYQIAVTSFGAECGAPSGSGVYTKVFPYTDWIEAQVWPNETSA